MNLNDNLNINTNNVRNPMQENFQDNVLRSNLDLNNESIKVN